MRMRRRLRCLTGQRPTDIPRQWRHLTRLVGPDIQKPDADVADPRSRAFIPIGTIALIYCDGIIGRSPAITFRVSRL